MEPGTLLVAAVLTAVLLLIIRSLVRKKKAGDGGCGCGCGSCPNRGFCHPEQTEKRDPE